ncbi:hypothetical protein fHeYen901_167 [Yersinia phage fHe-Yen9-01]|uniref:Uncharacterized protein n=1 Tax=Yersinia phage fHe-Yen9-01 TaxID=1965363 RepID=A0A1V0DXR9_9CAUD|nr:tail fiber chaperone [Yersinia phage fHe-Yen9-01]ARB05940.1 hypothetical protein fHeYen901_167 [Yersinia phage fHe-Yen9-01]
MENKEKIMSEEIQKLQSDIVILKSKLYDTNEVLETNRAQVKYLTEVITKIVQASAFEVEGDSIDVEQLIQHLTVEVAES